MRNEKTFYHDRCDKHKTRETIPQTCAVCQRIDVEHNLTGRLVLALIDAGYKLNINNGGDDHELNYPSDDPSIVLSAMFETDMETIHVYRSPNGSSDDLRQRHSGWVSLIYGNDGWDVISDYSVNLSAVVDPIVDYANTLA